MWYILFIFEEWLGIDYWKIGKKKKLLIYYLLFILIVIFEIWLLIFYFKIFLYKFNERVCKFYFWLGKVSILLIG